ncbi:MAG: hypothetical protein ACOH1R_06750 [Luteimonas sp.]
MSKLSSRPALIRWSGRFAAVVFLTTSLSSIAIGPQGTHDKSIKAAQVVAALGMNVGGEFVNYFSGNTSFKATDLSIRGNSTLPVSIGRVYSVEPERMITAQGTPHNTTYSYNRMHAFGDWDLDIPHIAGTFAMGWTLDSTTPLNRCSVIGQVRNNGQPATGIPANSTYHDADEFFGGYTLDTDDGSKMLLVANAPGVAKPTSGGPYHWTTTDNWWVSCLPNIQNGQGEGYLAVSPTGTKYYFDWLSSRTVNALRDTIDLGNDKYRDMYTYLRENRMLPTKVEDRFGNWVEYHYSADEFARLLSISSNDGRSISVQYNAQGHVASVSGGGSTITYSYRPVRDGESLATVVLPDTSAWAYDFSQTYYMRALPAPTSDSEPCSRPADRQPPLDSYECVGWPKMPVLGNPEPTAIVKTPSGATVLYVFKQHYQLVAEGGYTHDYPIGLSTKTVSGPGISPKTWQYVFASNAATTKTQCLSSGCPVTISTDEIGPDSSVNRRVFGLLKSIDQALLVRESQGTMSSQGVPSFLRTTDYSYHIGLPVGHPPGATGTSFTLFCERRLPVEVRKVSEAGKVFRRQVNSWDALDRELSVTSTSFN